ncbi:MAG: hypothetical protein N3E39_01055 [Candidatus Methanomethylicia archaeon]|nr:hypothetical protein [Candidatus Methanomethylicia archaeon]MDW7988536.1 hypothetical protein [Nitrososphaerota archaeon]
MKNSSFKRKILKVALIIKIIIIFFKLMINFLVLILEYMEFRIKIRIIKYFYERNIRKNLEKYGIRRDIAIKISKELSQIEYYTVKNLISIRGIRGIMKFIERS